MPGMDQGKSLKPATISDRAKWHGGIGSCALEVASVVHGGAHELAGECFVGVIPRGYSEAFSSFSFGTR